MARNASGEKATTDSRLAIVVKAPSKPRRLQDLARSANLSEIEGINLVSAAAMNKHVNDPDEQLKVMKSRQGLILGALKIRALSTEDTTPQEN